MSTECEYDCMTTATECEYDCTTVNVRAISRYESVENGESSGGRGGGDAA